MTSSNLQIDHITVAGSSLEALRHCLNNAGLPTEYGGAHSNGVTHMDVAGLPDGSYLELISSISAVAEPSLFWSEHIRQNGGPCAWAVRAFDIRSEIERLGRNSIPIGDARMFHRERPDGARVEWLLAFPGEEPPGATLPFLIEDITPRDLRVRPTPAIAELGEDSSSPVVLRGVARVVLSVKDLRVATELFRQAYDWPAPHTWGDRFVAFPGTPVILDCPPRNARSLRERLEAFGNSPRAFLIAVDSLDAACRHFPLSSPENWLDLRVAWLDVSVLHELFGAWSHESLGFVEV